MTTTRAGAAWMALATLAAASFVIACAGEHAPAEAPVAADPALAPSTTTTAMKKPTTNEPVSDPAALTDEQWRRRLTPEQYRVLRESGTETAFTGKYWNESAPGVYHCAGCGAVLFRSDEKFASHCGWPAFAAPAAPEAIDERTDTSWMMVRTEVMCSKCGGHLGHVFDDGPASMGGMRYCINSAALTLEPKPGDASQAPEVSDSESQDASERH